MEQYPINPSFEVSKSLPKLLPPTRTGDPPISIISYASPIRVAYSNSPVPELLDAYVGTVDMVLHIGMASGRTYYTAEKHGHRDGYTKHKDIDGRRPAPATGPLDADVPELLTTSLAFEPIVALWQDLIRAIPAGEAGHAADVRPSENAGYFLCDYTYFTSLKWYGRKHECMRGGDVRTRPVLFFHVPAESDERSLNTGVVVVEQLIRAMVHCFVQQDAQESNGV